jgi:hypothetical protein
MKSKEETLKEIQVYVESTENMPLEDRFYYVEHHLEKYPQLTQIEKECILQEIAKDKEVV